MRSDVRNRDGIEDPEEADRAEAIRLLRRIMDRFPTDDDVTNDRDECTFCDGEYKGRNRHEHTNDCPWVATRDLLASLEL